MSPDMPADCRGMAEVFENPRTHDLAKAVCMTCPSLAPCAKLRDQVQADAVPGGGYVGTWAGELIVAPTEEWRARRREIRRASRERRKAAVA